MLGTLLYINGTKEAIDVPDNYPLFYRKQIPVFTTLVFAWDYNLDELIPTEVKIVEFELDRTCTLHNGGNPIYIERSSK